MKAYSQDLRERALALVQKGDLSQPRIADQFQIAFSALEKWVRRERETGSCAARPHGGGPVRSLQECESFLRSEIKRHPDAALDELCARVAEGVHASPSMMCRELKHLKLPRKKSLHDSQRDTPRVRRLRREFDAEIRPVASAALGHLKFIDECVVHLGLTRLFGRAAPGERVVEGTPGYSGPHYTIVAALGLQGIGAPWLFDGATIRIAF